MEGVFENFMDQAAAKVGSILQIVMILLTGAAAWFGAQNQIAILQLELKFERRIQEELSGKLKDLVHKDQVSADCLSGAVPRNR